MWQVYGYLLAFQNRLALHISKVVVAKPHRRRGIAKALIKVCCQPLKMLQICLQVCYGVWVPLTSIMQSLDKICDVVCLLAGSGQ